MFISRFLLAGLLAFGWASAAAAQAAQEAPDWTLDVGAAARVRPYHLGADRYTWDVLPIVEGRIGDRVHISLDDGVRWSALVRGPFSAGPVLEYRQAYNDHLTVTGPKPGGDLELGGFASVETRFGQGELRFRKALNGYRGWSGDLAWDIGGPIGAGYSANLEARTSWSDAAYLQRQLGLRANGREEFSFKRGDSYAAGLELDISRPLTSRVTASLQFSDDHLLGARPASPQFKSRDEFVLGLGLTYRFSGSR